MPPETYATLEEYRDRQVSPDDDDTELTAQLLAASRLVDRRLRVQPGYFLPHDATYYFPGSGDRDLWLRDGEGLAYCLRSTPTDGIRPDYDERGRYDTYHWTLSDDWIWPVPRNAADDGRPYLGLRLMPYDEAPLTYWPYSPGGTVRIEGSWGWAALPPEIKEFTVYLARDMRDSQRGGLSAQVNLLEDGTPLRNDSWALWQSVKQAYSRDYAMGVY